MVALVLELVGAVVSLVVSILPVSPFQSLGVDGIPAQAIGWINWFLPIGNMVTLLSLWAAAILAFRVAKKLLSVASLVGVKG